VSAPQHLSSGLNLAQASAVARGTSSTAPDAVATDRPVVFASSFTAVPE
jgi:hypothetical protein